MTTFGSASCEGGVKDGKGRISTKSGALSGYPYGFASRFEGKPVTGQRPLTDLAGRIVGELECQPETSGSGGIPMRMRAELKAMFRDPMSPSGAGKRL